MGSIGTIIIILILVIICIFSFRGYLKKLANGCCGSGGDSVKKVKVTDKDASHYPYSVKLEIEGMTCGNCKARVENALNSLDGVWAEVDLGTNSAIVRMKEKLSNDDLRKTVLHSGYAVTKVI